MANEIDDILNRCIDLKRSGGDAETILHGESPQTAAEVRSLLALACELEALPAVSPTGEAMVKLTARLAAQKQSAPRKVRLFSLGVLARAAAILVCVLLVGWGASAASSDTVPGDWLYPVKLLTEKARFFLTLSNDDKVELRIVFSDERLKEFVTKHQNGRGIDKTLLTAMLDEAKAAVNEVSNVSAGGRELLATRVAYQAQFQRSTLAGMKTRASSAEQQELAPYVERCSEQCMAACQLMNATLGEPGAAMRCPMCQQALDKASDKK